MNVIVLKKMKKGLILAAAACLTILGAKAQTATTKVNVILNPALSIEVNEGSLDLGGKGLEEAKAINLVYRTAADYTSGVKRVVADHLKVTAVGTGYKIYAKTSGTTLTRVGTHGDGALATMPGENVTVSVGGQSGFTIKAISDDNSTTRGKAIYTSAVSNSSGSVVALPLPVEYAAKALNSADVKNFLGTNNTQGAKYTVNVMYEILAD